MTDDDSVLVTIITDGEENSSEEYTGRAIATIIDELKKKGWMFTYIGANQDVVSVAMTININVTFPFISFRFYAKICNLSKLCTFDKCKRPQELQNP